MSRVSRPSRESLRTRSKDHLDASQFKMLDKLGTGSFGAVYRAVYRATGAVCAIKRIDMENSDDEIDEIQKEIAILSGCNDAHITRYYGCFVHEYELWIVMEFLGGGSCLDLIKELGPLPESAIAEIMSELLAGLAYLHSTGKIHRDIKAANILVAEDGAVKIADFGVAAQLSNNISRRNTFVGTPFWMAPEVIDQKAYSFPADIWSLGITAMELANGAPPLSHIPPMKALFAIPREKPPRLDDRFSPEFRDFVSSCLQKEPDARATIQQLRKSSFLRKASRSDLVRIVHKRQLLSSAATKPPSEPQPASREFSTSSGASTLAGDEYVDNDEDWDLPSSVTSASATATVKGSATPPSVMGDNDDGEDEDEDWDFDGTIRPTSHASLDQILQNPPQGLVSDMSISEDTHKGTMAINSPIPTPSPPPSTSTSKQSTKRHLASDTLSAPASHTSKGQRAATSRRPRDPATDTDTLTLRSSGIQRYSSLVRVIDHASRKFKDSGLREVAAMLASDPPTVAAEQYIVRKVGKIALDRNEIRAPNEEKHPPFNAVEEVLFQRWLDEYVPSN